MSEKLSKDLHGTEEIECLLARIQIIREACELDVLGFLQRHPRTLLRSEQLAAFLGSDVKRVARAVDAFIDAGLLERTQNLNHAARMYLLVRNGPQGGGIKELLEVASTRQGRREILQLLGPAQSQSPGSLEKEAQDIVSRAQDLHRLLARHE